MKKTALAALSIALLVGATACSDKTRQATVEGETVETVETFQGTDQGEGFASSTNIRYVDLDSVGKYYIQAQEVQKFTLSTYSDLDQAQRVRAAEIQKFANQIEDKARSNGYLSQQSYEADMQKLQKMQNDAQNAVAAMQSKAENELAVKNQELTDSIQSFIVDFNRSRKYDAILIKATGLYFNPALDITKEVIDGLNARYKK